MGRSRHDFQAPVYSRSERYTRRRDANSGENSESMNLGKWALYHCNYCNKDISKRIRMKCAVCADFDLCVECFSVGAEMSPHLSSHSYRVIDVDEDLSFPLICPDWNAREEMMVLEGVECYGLDNWAEVAEHVGTKSKEQCRDHYRNVYLDSPDSLPDTSHLVGKNKDDLLAWAKSLEKDTKDIDCTVPSDISSVAAAAALDKASNVGQVKDKIPTTKDRTRKRGQRRTQKPSSDGRRKNRPSCSERRKKAPSCDDDGPSSPWPEGYNPQRHEFETEYDDDAEKLLTDMEFDDKDTEEEHELKVRVMHIYLKRVNERNRRKDFLRERNLLQPSPFEQSLSPEERALCRRYDFLMRLHPKEEHDEFLQTVIREHRIKKRLAELKEARAAGCRTSAEADRYLEPMRNLQVDGSSGRARASPLVSAGSGGEPCNLRSTGDLHARRVHSALLLSEAEKRLCGDCNLAPAIYLKIQEIISQEIFKGTVTKKSDTHRLLKIHPGTLDRIYDMLVKKGIAPP